MKDAATRGHRGIEPAPLPAIGAATGSGDVRGPDAIASLPRDHPNWQRDVLAISSRTRAMLGSLRPLAVRVLTFWDHAVRTVMIGARTVEIDPSGSYRLR